MRKVILLISCLFSFNSWSISCEKSDLEVKAIYFPNNESEILDMWSKQSGNLIAVQYRKSEENLSLKLEFFEKDKVVYSDILKFDAKHQVKLDFQKIQESHAKGADKVVTMIGKNQSPFLESCRTETKLILEEAIGAERVKYEKK